jgi:hypothetical protein
MLAYCCKCSATLNSILSGLASRRVQVMTPFNHGGQCRAVRTTYVMIKMSLTRLEGFPGFPADGQTTRPQICPQVYSDVSKTSHPESHVNWMSRASFRVTCFRMVHDSLGLTEGLYFSFKLDSQFNNNNNYYYYYYSPSILRQVIVNSLSSRYIVTGGIYKENK